MRRREGEAGEPSSIRDLAATCDGVMEMDRPRARAVPPSRGRGARTHARTPRKALPKC